LSWVTPKGIFSNYSECRALAFMHLTWRVIRRKLKLHELTNT
jgi:hypothetical protein